MTKSYTVHVLCASSGGTELYLYSILIDISSNGLLFFHHIKAAFRPN